MTDSNQNLCNAALNFAYDCLHDGGSFICKFYQGPEDKVFEMRLKSLFGKVHREKPHASWAVGLLLLRASILELTNGRNPKRRILSPYKRRGISPKRVDLGLINVIGKKSVFRYLGGSEVTLNTLLPCLAEFLEESHHCYTVHMACEAAIVWWCSLLNVVLV